MSDSVKVILYGTALCGYCVAARRLLKKKGINFEDIRVSDGDTRRELAQRTGKNTVPQIFINDEAIGGFDELYALEEDGHLDALLARAQ
jgi:glutaredoxin 3